MNIEPDRFGFERQAANVRFESAGDPASHCHVDVDTKATHKNCGLKNNTLAPPEAGAAPVSAKPERRREIDPGPYLQEKYGPAFESVVRAA